MPGARGCPTARTLAVRSGVAAVLCARTPETAVPLPGLPEGVLRVLVGLKCCPECGSLIAPYRPGRHRAGVYRCGGACCGTLRTQANGSVGV